MLDNLLVAGMLGNIPMALVAAVLAGLVRNVFGFLENALKDGKLDKYEIMQLIGTVTKYFAGVLLLSFGMPIPQAVAGVFGLDVVATALKKKPVK